MFRFPAFFIVILCFAFNADAQLQFDRKSFDFGPIENFNNDTAYFTLSNTGPKNIYLLPTIPKDEYAVLRSSGTIAPGESITIAIVYYTSDKGKFNLEVPLYFSHQNDAIVLKVQGNIKSILPTAFSVCPSIENSAPLKPSQVPLSIIVRDAETQQQLDKARVSIVKKNVEYNCVPGFRNMAYMCRCDYGKIEVKAEKENYVAENMLFDYDANNNTCIIYLSRKSETPNADTIPETQRIVKTYSYDTVPDPVYIPVGKPDEEFSTLRYKPNHLVFIIDISGSMKDSTKLNYLKQTIQELINIIRPEDYFTLITYASKVKVVFEHVNGSRKNEISTAIDTMRAAGASSGAYSLEIAYGIAVKHFIKGGNNQVFLATDGLFNSSKITDDDLYKMARKENNRNHVILSTIGFGRDEKALEFLKKLARNGNGSYIYISQWPDDKSLVTEEVKKQSLIP